jgi:2-octaprenyl-6-methoxyphenol hydroxylase
MLKALGVWSSISDSAQPVTTIEITDSALEAGIRPVLLSYDNHIETGEPAAHIVPGGILNQALRAAALKHGSSRIALFGGQAIEAHNSDAASTTAILSDGNSLIADLIIAADGRKSGLREQAGIKTVQWRYEQTGIVTTVRHDRPHCGKAVQHFLPGGPFAILPLPGDRSCITWSEERTTAERIMLLDDEAFLGEVQRRFGGKLGLLQLEGRRSSFPLGMHLARELIGKRFCLIGDAAHGVHPIAGQGLNLAFRDVAALAECISDGVRAGFSFGDFTILERYQAWRRFDSAVSAASFDAINRLFSNDVTLLRSAREVGLGLVDRTPALKQMFVTEAAGLSGDVPRLMR